MALVIYSLIFFHLILTHALRMGLHHEIRFKILSREEKRERMLSVRGSKLWILRTSSIPPEVHAYVGPRTYIVRSDMLAEYTGEYAPLEAQHKYPFNMNTSLGIIIRCIDVAELQYVSPIILSKQRAFLKGPISNRVLNAVASQSTVLWISPVQRFKRHLASSRILLYGQLNGGQGRGERMMITDTGLDPLHCMFYPNTSTGVLGMTGPPPLLSPSDKVLITSVEYAPAQFTNASTYDDAHGTATAGVAAGQVCDGNQGVASQAQILFLDYSGFCADGSRDCLYVPSDMSYSFAAGYVNNCSVHSASWGGAPGGYYDDYSHQFDDAAWRYDLLQVVSAGNDGPTGIEGSPATGKNSLSVGASLSFPAAFPGWDTAANPTLYDYDSVAMFSSIGPLLDGRRAPVLLAPGVAVEVAYALAEPGIIPHDDYVYESGTSFSAPAVAGLALLIDEYQRNATGHRASASMKIAAMIAWARPASRVVQVDFATQTVAVLQGAPASMAYGVPLFLANNTIFIDNATVNATNERLAFCFVPPSGLRLNIALSWIDLAAFPYASEPLINDLDMFVIHDGNEYSTANHVDPSELIVIGQTSGTLIRVVVSPVVLTTPSQAYSIAIAGWAGPTFDCGTCLLSDGVGCSSNGTFLSPLQQSCPNGLVYNGSACIQPQTLGGTCSVPHGTGLYSPACLPVSCDTNYFLSLGGCVCLPAMVCPNGGAVQCVNNTFPQCPQVFIPQSFVASTPSDNLSTAWIVLIVIVGTIVGLLALCFIVLHVTVTRQAKLQEKKARIEHGSQPRMGPQPIKTTRLILDLHNAA